MADKMAYHPNGTRIRFQEHNHSYIDQYGTRYVSGTTFVKPFFPVFDMPAVAKRCAAGTNPKYAGRTTQEIMAEWRKEGQRGSQEGDNTHEYAEGLMSGWSINRLPTPISARCQRLFRQVEKITHWLSRRYVFVEAEKIVFSPDLRISGMIDLVMWDPETQEILILDWKQNKELSTENFYQSGLPPIDHLQDTHINKYTLQLSLYQYIIHREQYFPQATGYRRALLHITPEDVVSIKLDYFGYEIKEMLTWKKQSR